MWAGIAFCFTLISFSTILKVDCAPLPQDKLPSKEMEKFMKQYGYIESGPDDADALYTEEGFKKAIQQMQKFGGLPQTGELDEATLNLTKTPRCGVPDVIEHRRSKRYVIGSGAWKKRNITYFFRRHRSGHLPRPMLKGRIHAPKPARAVEGVPSPWGPLPKTIRSASMLSGWNESHVRPHTEGFGEFGRVSSRFQLRGQLAKTIRGNKHMDESRKT
ncbi:hypothetical protein AVEN_56660-1 [Araneus ventricosus]|uniref:Peptidoglycan binding-like domain-containing protein n=1 Tax=Araneus ventricosus TaxID=182803 RepID=A0A4Y2I0D5_ARAVE|nr:hypothetical protein AVEN_56660-1 [Araneus ventricosus]